MAIHSCPTCGSSLGEVGPTGFLHAVCATCERRYQVLEGTALNEPSGRLAPDAITQAFRGRPQPEPDLRIQVSPIDARAIRIPTPRDRAPVTVKRGDRIAVMHVMRGDKLEDLLWVANLTTGERMTVSAPGSSAELTAVMLSLVPTALVGIGLAFTSIPGALGLVVAMGTGLGSLALLTRGLSPRHALSAGERVEVEASQRLLDTRRRLQAQRSAIEIDATVKATLRTRLMGLQEKMRMVGLPAYADRLAAMEDAVRLLDEQLALHGRLLGAYDTSIAMVEIEYETSDSARLEDADVAAAMRERLAELKSLEQEHEDVARQLAANAEVELLLRG